MAEAIPYSPVPSETPSAAPVPFISEQAGPANFGGTIGRALQGAGQSISEAQQKSFELQQHFQQIANETAANEGSNAYTDFVSKKELDFRSLEGNNAVAAFPGFQKDLQDELQRMAKGMGNPMAQRAFLADARNTYNRSMYSAGLHVGDQAKIANDAAWAGKVKAIDDFTTLHYNDPKAVGDGIQQTVDATISRAHARGITDPDAVHAQVSQAVGDMISNVITATMVQGSTVAERRAALTNAQQMLQTYGKSTIPGSPDVPMLDAAHQDRLAQTLQNRDITITNAENAEEARKERLENEAAAHVRVGIAHALTNSTAMIERGFPAAGLPSDKQIQAAFPHDPERAAEMMDQVQDLRAISGYLSVLPGATPEQVADIERKIAPDPSNPSTFAKRARLSNAFDAAMNARNKAIASDPAGYLLQAHTGYNIPTYGDLQAQYDTAIKNPSALVGKDGQTAFGAYAQHIQAVQATMGVPESMRHVLPTATARTIADSIAADPSSAAKKVQQVQTEFGDSWVSVWHDITTVGKLPAEYQLIGALDNKQDSEYLARAMQEGKAGKNVDDLLPPKAAADIKATILNNAQLNNYLFSLDVSGASDEQKMGIRDATLKLAYARAFYGRDQNAAANAIKSVTGNYEFLPGGARVPVGISDVLKLSARNVVNGLDANKIAIPSVYGQPGMPDARDYLDAIKANPNWITSPKGDALWLKDNGNRIVLGKDGKPISVPFSSVPTGPVGWMARMGAKLMGQ